MALAFLALTGVASAQATVILRVDDNQTTMTPTGLAWSLAYPTLQGALDEARVRAATVPTTDDVAQIWVARGIYKPTATSDRTISHLLVPNVRVYGGFNGNETALTARAGFYTQTILSGDIDSDPRNQLKDSLHVVRVDDSGEYRLDGFQIMFGAAVPTIPTTVPSADDLGGGMLVNYDAEPDVVVLVTNCRFQACIAGTGGAFMANTSQVDISRSQFVACSAFGIALGSPIMGNSIAGAAGFGNCSRAYIYHSTFDSNRSVHGGAVGYSTGADNRLVNCLLVNNVAQGGGGGAAIVLSSQANSPLRVDFCTIANNQALVASPSAPTPLYVGGGGIHVHTGALLDVRSSILWGNIGPDTGTPGGESIDGIGATAANVNATFSDIQWAGAVTPVWFTGAGLINLVPLFNGAPTGDFTLSTAAGAVSPCIDVADDAVLDFNTSLGDVLDVNENGVFSEHVPIDLGLILSRESDVLTVPNGGLAAAVTGIIADMGAFEAILSDS